MKKESYANFVPLKVPSWMEMAVQSGRQESSMKSVLPLFYGITSHVTSRLVGKFLKEVAREYVGPSLGFSSHVYIIRVLQESDHFPSLLARRVGEQQTGCTIGGRWA
jgi:hypothetical protein